MENKKVFDNSLSKTVDFDSLIAGGDWLIIFITI